MGYILVRTVRGSRSGETLADISCQWLVQWEREAISERTQEAMSELKRRVIRIGRAAYGWQWSSEPDATGRKQLIPHPREQAAVRRICELHRQGKSISEIAVTLDREGIETTAYS